MGQLKYLASAGMIIVLMFVCIAVFRKLTEAPWITSLENEKYSEAFCGTTSPDTMASSSEGGQIFRANCATCHALDKVLSGPALRGVMERGPWKENEKNFVKWVRNPAAFVPTTSYTLELQKQYGQIMPSFSHLPEQDIWAIRDYLRQAKPGTIYIY